MVAADESLDLRDRKLAAGGFEVVVLVFSGADRFVLGPAGTYVSTPTTGTDDWSRTDSSPTTPVSTGPSGC